MQPDPAPQQDPQLSREEALRRLSEPPSAGAIKSLTAIWLLLSQAIILTMGVITVVTATTVAGGFKLLGAMSDVSAEEMDEAVDDVIVSPLLEYGGLAVLVCFGFAGSWMLWKRRKYAWAAMISSLPLLYLLLSGNMNVNVSF